MFDLTIPETSLTLLGSSNHNLPISIEGVAQVRIEETNQMGYAILYTVCGERKKVVVQEKQYALLKQMFDGLRELEEFTILNWINSGKALPRCE